MAGLANLYINDAFAAAHRAHASTEEVAHHLPAVAGLLIAGGAFEELAVVETKALDAGEIAHYAAEVVVRETGAYTIYAYLYDGASWIRRKVEHIYVE